MSGFVPSPPASSSTCSSGLLWLSLCVKAQRSSHSLETPLSAQFIDAPLFSSIAAPANPKHTSTLARLGRTHGRWRPGRQRSASKRQNQRSDSEGEAGNVSQLGTEPLTAPCLRARPLPSLPTGSTNAGCRSALVDSE